MARSVMTYIQVLFLDFPKVSRFIGSIYRGCFVELKDQDGEMRRTASALFY